MDSQETTEVPTSPSSLNPKEILKYPTKERPQKLQEFKEQLAANKKDLSNTLQFLAHYARYYPDLTKEQFMDYFQKIPGQENLTPTQKDLIQSGIDLYLHRHQQVKQIRAAHPNDHELFGFLFGHQPKGKVEVIVGPITLYFRCNNPEDYAYVYGGNFRDKESGQPDVAAANKSGGVFIQYPEIKGLEHSIILENAHGRDFNTQGKQILTHEEQHAVMALFEDSYKKYSAQLFENGQKAPSFVKENIQVNLFISELALKVLKMDLQDKNEQEQQALIHQALVSGRAIGERRAKDEILAYWKDGREIPTIRYYLKQPKEEGGLYDYFSQEWRKMITNRFVEKLGEPLRPLIEQNIEKVFVTEYQQEILENSFNALGILKMMGISRQQTLNLLINEPLPNWKKVVLRLQEEQRKPSNPKAA